MQQYQNQRERESSSSHYGRSHRTPTQEKQIVQYLDVQIQGRQNATMVSVCVKGTARAENNVHR